MARDVQQYICNTYAIHMQYICYSAHSLAGFSVADYTRKTEATYYILNYIYYLQILSFLFS